MKAKELLRRINQADPHPTRCSDGYIWVNFSDALITITWSGDDGSFQKESWKLVYQRSFSDVRPA